ncbi:nitroreductase family protein [Actinomadura xylanilytica]|nr:nitroreductase family protein [Actinomadura xylanilytica]MDL4771036.1 nitroreductase family protein [Actinomadura xylanilytica]
MDFSEVLRRRRMVRRYSADPVDPETVAAIARLVRRAPSAGFSQGHRLLVVTGPATRERIAEIAEEDWYVQRGLPRWLSVAPVLMVLGVSEDAYHERYTKPDKLVDGEEMLWPAPYWWVDAGALLTLIQLAAIDAGLVTGFSTVRRSEELKKLVGLPDEVAVVGLITLGHPEPGAEDGTDAARLRTLRKPFGDLVRYESWDEPQSGG